MYLVKSVGWQELGWRNGTPRGGGSYLLITKEWWKWFPPLSATTFNDAALLRLQFPSRSALVPLVWHNAKHLPEELARRNLSRGHDEYRIYIAGLAQNGIVPPVPEDLVVFKPTALAGLRDSLQVWIVRKADPLHAQLRNGPEAGGNYWVTDSAMGAAWRLPGDRKDLSIDLNSSQALQRFRPKSHGVSLFDDGMPEPIDASSDEAVPVIGPEVGKYLGALNDEIFARRTSNETFRTIVLNAYNMRCAFTGSAIALGDGLVNLEAAHIKPQAHDGLNLPSNGIALSRDLHWAFDKGAFTLTNDLRAEVHPDVEDETLRKIHGKQAFRPDGDFYAPRREFSDHHRARVYGLFKCSGSIRRAV